MYNPRVLSKENFVSENSGWNAGQSKAAQTDTRVTKTLEAQRKFAVEKFLTYCKFLDVILSLLLDFSIQTLVVKILRLEYILRNKAKAIKLLIRSGSSLDTSLHW